MSNGHLRYPNNVVAEAGTETDRSLRLIIDKVNPLSTDVATVSAKVAALHIPTIAEIKAALSLGGSSPINVTGLQGVLANAQIAATVGTHAQRLAATPTVGAVWIESDRNNLVYVGTQAGGAAAVWTYVTGTMRGTLSPDLKPAGLTTADTGLLFYSTDFDRTYRWDGAAWLDYNSAARGIYMLYVAPTTAGWHLADGSAATRSTEAGLTTAITLPDLVSSAAQYSYFKTNAAYTNSLQPPVAPTFTGGSFTPIGAVTSTFSGSALGTHQHELPIQTPNNTVERFTDPATFGTGTSRAAISKVTTTADTTSAPVALDQPVSAGTPSGTVTSSFVGTSAAVTGTISTTGEPQHLNVLAYFRF